MRYKAVGLNILTLSTQLWGIKEVKEARHKAIEIKIWGTNDKITKPWG